MGHRDGPSIGPRNSPWPPHHGRAFAPAAAILLTASLISLCAVPVLSGAQPAPQPDRVTLKSVVPAPGRPLVPGHLVDFRVTVEYALATHNVAVLGLYIEMFPKNGSGCAGGIHQTNGGTYINLVHGTGTRTITVRWNGTTPNQVGAPGSLGFGANFWTTDRSKEIKAFGILDPQHYCYPFS